MPAAGPGKKLCGANLKGGRACRNPAGARTEHLGVGRCYRHGGNTPNHKAAAEVELAKQAVQRYGLAVDIDPALAMMKAVARSYGSVLYLRAQVAELDVPWVEDKPHVAWTMLMAEEKHHNDVCRDAQRAGVERRAIEMQEDLARQMVAFASAFARALGLDPSAPDVRAAGRKAFELLPGGEAAERQ